MSFIWPTMLFLLALAPALVALYAVAHRRRLPAGLVHSWLAAGRPGRRTGWRRHLPPAILIVGVTLLLFAMARPRMAVSLPRVEGSVILAFDVSGSMAAEDSQREPTRLEAAKAAAIEFVHNQPAGVRIGIVAFSDNGFQVQTPTNDQAAILATIERLKPERGTSLASGILAALSTLFAPDAEAESDASSLLTAVPTPPAPSRAAVNPGSAAIVLLTDGENNESPDPLAAAQAAAEQGVRVYTVGVGSAAGTSLHIDGFYVHTRLNEDILKQIAAVTGGAYYNAESEQDLRAVYQDLRPELVVRPEDMEVTAIVAGVGLLIVLIAGAFSLFWFGRLP